MDDLRHAGDGAEGVRLMELDFTQGDLVEWLAEPELRPDRRMDLGDVLEVEKLLIKCRGWIGDSPVALRPDNVSSTLNIVDQTWQRQERPEFCERFVLTTFGIHSVEGLLDPEALGLELLYRDNTRHLNQGQRIHINCLFPSARFLLSGTRQHEASRETGIDLDTSAAAVFRARLSAPGVLVPIATDEGSASADVQIKGSATNRVAVTDTNKVVWSTTTYTPVVEAFGEADTRAQWVFHRGHGPLSGKTLETVTGLTVSRYKRGIEFDARMFVVFKLGPYPFRRYSDWIRLTADWGQPDL